jgi:diketogulonate reductase-like aldo/keto reductase
MEFCQKHQVQLEAYAPLVKASVMDNPVLVEMASKYGKTPAQILIRWPLQHDVIVIPKSSNPKRIEENIDVFDFEIDAEDMKKLDSLNQDIRTSWNPEDEIQVKSFSSYAVRKASLIIKKLRSL